jgi:hypothetical protein
MKLFIIHCGFNDDDISDGVYEFHINIPVVAEDLLAAKKKAHAIPIFIKKKMHIDGVHEISEVGGYNVSLTEAL